MILAGDIGGTKVDIALYERRDGARVRVMEHSLRTGDHADLATPLRAVIRNAPAAVERCVLGAAGPVVDGRAVGVNVPWRVDQRELSAALDVPVVLLNDLEALAYAVPHLVGDDLLVLQQGLPDPVGAKAIVAPGTGLGEGYLAWDGARYRPHPSEGGHADFAPTDPLQMRLLAYLLGRYEHVSYERVCSGIGLPDVFAFLRDIEAMEEPDSFAAEMAVATDRTALIVERGLQADGRCPLCTRAVTLFARVLGAEAGNVGLRCVATGGVYIGGGMPPRMLPALTDGELLAAFLSKGRLRFLMDRIPLYIITRPKVGLYGAACYALPEPV